jgi:hypothetical protein
MSSRFFSKQLISTYRTIILPVVLNGCKNSGENTERECLRKGYWGEYLKLRGRNKAEGWRILHMRKFTTCSLHQILLGW